MLQEQMRLRNTIEMKSSFVLRIVVQHLKLCAVRNQIRMTAPVIEKQIKSFNETVMIMLRVRLREKIQKLRCTRLARLDEPPVQRSEDQACQRSAPVQSLLRR